MNNLIGISTGSLHSWYSTLEESIDTIRQFNVDALEISFGNTLNLNEKFSDDIIQYIRSLKHVSLHAPFFDENNQFYNFDRNAEENIKKISTFYKMFNADFVVFHPTKKAVTEFLKTDMKLCTENMPDEFPFTKKELDEILENNSLGIALDTSHAFCYGEDYLKEIIEKYRERIMEVHFSDRRYVPKFYNKKDHQQFLFCYNQKKFLPLRELYCPIIIEISLKHRRYDLKNLELEINSVIDFFK